MLVGRPVRARCGVRRPSRHCGHSLARSSAHAGRSRRTLRVLQTDRERRSLTAGDGGAALTFAVGEIEEWRPLSCSFPDVDRSTGRRTGLSANPEERAGSADQSGAFDGRKTGQVERIVRRIRHHTRGKESVRVIRTRGEQLAIGSRAGANGRSDRFPLGIAATTGRQDGDVRGRVSRSSVCIIDGGQVAPCNVRHAHTVMPHVTLAAAVTYRTGQGASSWRRHPAAAAPNRLDLDSWHSSLG